MRFASHCNSLFLRKAFASKLEGKNCQHKRIPMGNMRVCVRVSERKRERERRDRGRERDWRKY